jgi:hypothetical protein
LPGEESRFATETLLPGSGERTLVERLIHAADESNVGSPHQVLTKPRHVPPGARRPLRWVGLALGGAVGVLVVVSAIETAAAVHHAQKVTALGPYRPPASAVVCEQALNEACAQRAATRVQLPVAWLPAPRGYGFKWLVALSTEGVPPTKWEAFEALSSSTVDLQVSTQPQGPWQPGNERLIGTYVEHDTTVYAYQDLYGYGPSDPPGPTTMTLRWLHGGIQYQLSVGPHYLLQRLVLHASDFARFVAEVRYAAPQ